MGRRAGRQARQAVVIIEPGNRRSIVGSIGARSRMGKKVVELNECGTGSE